jgi:ribosomal protein S18 acetylase RimI-like enzyme
MTTFYRPSLGDVDRIARLEAACFGVDDGMFSRRQLRALVVNPLAFWLLGNDGRAMACWLKAGNGRAHWARLYSLAVHPDLRGLGVGARLLAAGEAWMRREGLVICRAEVKQDNQAARRLYARHGFEEAAVLRDYYAPGVHGLRLIKALTANDKATDTRTATVAPWAW